MLYYNYATIYILMYLSWYFWRTYQMGFNIILDTYLNKPKF